MIENDPIVADLTSKAEKEGIQPGIYYEKMVAAFARHFIKKGDHVLDIGAHKGLHTRPMSKSASWTGKVSAFEPLPHLRRALKKKLTYKERWNTRLYPFATGAQCGHTSFEYFHKYPAFSGLKRRHTPFDDTEGELETIFVDVVTLDSMFAKDKKVSFMKLDIEGGEFHTFLGAEDILKNHRPLIVFENGRGASAKTYGYTQEDFFQYFDKVGYEIFTIGGLKLTYDDWTVPHNCWEFFAFPRERAIESKILPKLAARL